MIAGLPGPGEWRRAALPAVVAANLAEAPRGHRPGDGASRTIGELWNCIAAAGLLNIIRAQGRSL